MVLLLLDPSTLTLNSKVWALFSGSWRPPGSILFDLTLLGSIVPKVKPQVAVPPWSGVNCMSIRNGKLPLGLDLTLDLRYQCFGVGALSLIGFVGIDLVPWCYKLRLYRRL